MARRRHTPEQIIRKLREADRLLGEVAPDYAPGPPRAGPTSCAGSWRRVSPVRSTPKLRLRITRGGSGWFGGGVARRSGFGRLWHGAGTADQDVPV